MRAETITQLIECLEQLAKHPDRFREKVVPRGQELGYISGVGLGLRFGLGLCDDIQREHELRIVAAKARGWDADKPPYEQMLDRGLSADETLSELARLEADFLKLASKSTF
jgi:hypothetical protein